MILIFTVINNSGIQKMLLKKRGAGNFGLLVRLKG